MNSKKDIVLLLPFYGRFPVWIDAFLRSCEFNPQIEWLIFSDIEKPAYQPENVQFIPLGKAGLADLIREKTGILHDLANPHKLCDFKPLYGHIFEEYIGDRTFWGHCDMDVIWGDMNSFLKGIDYMSYDIISSRQYAVSGHFTLYRNTSELNFFYKQVPNYKKAFSDSNYQGFDEGYFSFHLFQEIQNKNLNANAYWEKRNCIDRGELQRLPIGWYWRQGEIRNIFGLRGNYLHMIDWKHTLERVDLQDVTTLRFFRINQFGLWISTPSLLHLARIVKQFNPMSLLGYLARRIKRNLIPMKTNIRPNVPEGYTVLH
ncbi:MAG: hypothetical protein RIF33_09920 [Cyclobacteriaceae bacterium]